MTLVAVCVGAVGLALALSFALTGRDSRSTWPQAAPYLGGGEAQTHAWQRFHFRAYTMTLVFIAFEMEMMFMYPWAVVFVHEGLKAMAEMGMFLAILSIGILYGWREGVFRWQ
ncbi:NADH-quinone oxidoreductase subunit A [Tranquillimonas alkanivorans]|uniref:NADH-quinone oxidoreductase subunit n=1 Tax=Tranquillimonas alkanivorans TaxID=441119 RepID=A0A1I5LJ57_9RHOB|nr:NADH-quinone oxidoreductase subunit A [Tranquillimonas alkanivorans]SFO97348.1 NADH dehydrogenase subunit A [Tranquillimonas alkanivorans]